MTRRRDSAIAAGLVLLALATNFAFRGLVADDSTRAWELVDAFAGRRPLDRANLIEDAPPLFPFLVWLSFLVAGHDLRALHLAPFVAALANPVLAYLACRAPATASGRASPARGLLGAALFLGWPTAVFFYNQATAEPITLAIVWSVLLAYRARRPVLLLALAGLAVLSAYDALLPVLALAADASLRRREAPFFRRAATGLAAGFLAAALLAAVLAPELYTTGRLGSNLLAPLDRFDPARALARTSLVVRVWFAVVLVPLVVHGAAVEFRERRSVWAGLSVLGYCAYEAVVDTGAGRTAGVALRHLTLVVPAAVWLVLASLDRIGRAWPGLGPGARRALTAGLASACLGPAGVGVAHGYYQTGVQVFRDPAGIATGRVELPRHVPASPIGEGVAPVVLPLVEVPGPDGAIEATVDLPAPAGTWIEALVFRGRIELAWLRVEEPSVEIPAGAWDPISPGTHLAHGRPGVRLDSDEGFLAGMAHLPAVRLAGKRIRFACSSDRRYTLHVAVRGPGAVRRYYAVHPPLPGLLADPASIDRDVVRSHADQVAWRAGLALRPEGVLALAPLLDHDYVYYRCGDRVVESAPRHRLSIEGDPDPGFEYLSARPGRRLVVRWDAVFDRPVARVLLAAFAGHVAPGDRTTVSFATGGGPWRVLATLEGAGRRSAWTREVEGGGTELSVRFEIEGSTWGWSRPVVRSGLRDLAIAVRLAPEVP